MEETIKLAKLGLMQCNRADYNKLAQEILKAEKVFDICKKLADDAYCKWGEDYIGIETELLIKLNNLMV